VDVNTLAILVAPLESLYRVCVDACVSTMRTLQILCFYVPFNNLLADQNYGLISLF
jgi:hypothetical protein